jgi:hypothetical protein
MPAFVPPNFLNDDGTASMATMILLSHHAFRRDLTRFCVALSTIAGGDASRAAAVSEEWKFWRGALHGHHEMEDAHIFLAFRAEQPSLGALLDSLSAEHRRIDPLLERGDVAFEELPSARAAIEVVEKMKELLEAHLASEETGVVPLLRGAKTFPPPPSDAEAAMYADGFAWSTHGIAPDVLDRVRDMLPAAIESRLDDARARFDARCDRTWGPTRAGASRTSVPDT